MIKVHTIYFTSVSFFTVQVDFFLLTLNLVLIYILWRPGLWWHHRIPSITTLLWLFCLYVINPYLTKFVAVPWHSAVDWNFINPNHSTSPGKLWEWSIRKYHATSKLITLPTILTFYLIEFGDNISRRLFLIIIAFIIISIIYKTFIMLIISF